MNKDVMKKHHFWILAGIVPLFILLAVILTWTGASGEISAANTKVKGELESISKKTPNGSGYEKELEKQKALLGSKVGELWEANWKAQRDLIVWPKDGERGRLSQFLIDPAVKTKDGKPEFRKFGSPLDTVPGGRDVFEVFTNDKNYTAPFETAAKLIEPTQLLGGWQSIFRYIRGWGTKTPESDVLWLTLEDLWVQRGLMMPIKEVNDAVAAFRPVPTKPGPDGKVPDNKFTFRSRVWEVEFEIATRGQSKALQARLTNVTDRLQLLGARNSMTLNVWFDTSPSLEKGAAFPYQIQSEFVKAGETITVTYLPTFHELDAGANPTKVTKVEQVFDQRTVPVRRIDRLALGWLDNRHQYAELKPPTFIKIPDAAATGAASMPGESGPPVAGGPRGIPGGGPGGPGGGAVMPGTGTPDGGGPTGGPGVAGMAGTGTGWEAYRDSTMKRYIDVSDQVRRIPVALVLVVDQDYERDLLVAFANSALRFQITQVHSKRFRGAISTGPEPSGTDPFDPGSGTVPGTGTFAGQGAMIGSGFGDEIAGAGGPRGGGGAAAAAGPRGMAGPGAAFGGPRGGIAPPTGGGPGGFPSEGGFGGPTGIGSPLSGGGFGDPNLTGVAETSSASGLIEISIYGVVTLYERTEQPKTEGVAAPTPEPAAPLNPMNTNNTPAPAPAVPNNPMGTTPPADKPKNN